MAANLDLVGIPLYQTSKYGLGVDVQSTATGLLQSQRHRSVVSDNLLNDKVTSLLSLSQKCAVAVLPYTD
jgi:hypothetical protein